MMMMMAKAKLITSPEILQLREVESFAAVVRDYCCCCCCYDFHFLETIAVDFFAVAVAVVVEKKKLVKSLHLNSSNYFAFCYRYDYDFLSLNVDSRLTFSTKAMLIFERMTILLKLSDSRNCFDFAVSKKFCFQRGGDSVKVEAERNSKCDVL